MSHVIVHTPTGRQVFRVGASPFGPVLHRFDGWTSYPVDVDLNPAVPTWYGRGEGFSFPVSEAGLAETLRTLLMDRPGFDIEEPTSEIADAI